MNSLAQALCFNKASLRLGLAALACLIPAHVATAQSTTVVFNALKAFYLATGGDNWDTNTNWDVDRTSIPSAAELNSWYGVTYDGGDLEQLRLPGNGLRGTIPPELGVLVELDDLDLSNNELSGPIPGEIGLLVALDLLDLSYNQLTGNIPSEVSGLDGIDWIYLQHNELTGEIPTVWGNNDGIDHIYLNNNQLTGSIPANIGNHLTSLDDFNLSYNQLTGTIPAFDDSIDEIYLDHNQLTGTIPSSFGDLDGLDTLDLSFNQLTGTIPELDDTMDELYLSNNQLSGSIPTHLKDLTGLDVLDLSYNDFTGTIPEFDDTMDDLYLNNNQLSGSIPTHLDNLGSLDDLDLSFNDLTGSIPNVLGDPSLDRLNLSNNQLTGSIPSVFGSYSSLDQLDLSNNQLTGSIPDQLSNPSSLDWLGLSNNQLTGSFPTLSPGLDSLDFSNNQLTGSLPDAWSQMGDLDYLYLSQNQFSGEVPGGLGDAPTLNILDLSENQFSGAIPGRLGDASLITLDLSENQFSGEVPGGLGDLPNLTFLDLGGNDLTGRLPQNLTMLRFLFFISWEDNMGLCAPLSATFQAWLAGVRSDGIAVGPDCDAPRFTEAIGDKIYTVDETISDLLFPGVSGGVVPYAYTLTPEDLPAGLEYDASTRTLSGTPTKAQTARPYVYTVEDAEGSVVSETFFIEVRLALASILDQEYALGLTIEDLVLPDAFGGVEPYTYALSPVPPAGLMFDSESRTLSGTPTEPVGLTVYTYTATDAEGAKGYSAFGIAVRLVLATDIEDLSFRYGVEIEDVAFPEVVGGTDPFDYILIPDPPSGLAFDGASRTLSGTPAEALGPTDYTYVATDSEGASGEQAFSMEVLPMQIPPVANQQYVYGAEITPWELPDALGGFGPFGHTLAPALPAGLIFDSQTGVLSGTPGQATVPNVYTYAVEDAFGAEATTTFVMEIMLALTPVASQEYYVTHAIPDLVLPEADGGVEPYVYELSPALPPGLAFDAQTRTLSGTPTEEMESTVYTFAAAGAAGARGSLTFNIEVKVSEVLTLQPVSDKQYVYALPIQPLALPLAEGGFLPHRYTLNPALPAGLTFDPDPLARTLSGTPTAASAAVLYTYTATDSLGSLVSQQFWVEVTLALASTADQAYTVGEAIPDLVLPVAAGGTDPYVYALSPDPPPGLVYDVQARTLSGTPTAASAPVQYTYVATDAAGLAVTDTFLVAVNLALAPTADQTYVVGEAIPDLVLPAALGGTDPYTYTLSPDPPPGLVYDVQTRTLSGTPTEATASVQYRYTATDAVGHSLSDTFHVEVQIGLALIADQAYAVGEAIPDLVLPAALGGTDPYTYTLSPNPPPGLIYDTQTRTLSGTPMEVMVPTLYTYTATDAAGLRGSKSFSMEVLPALMLPAVADQVYVVDREIMLLELPEAMGGRSPHRYMLKPDPPPGLVFDSLARTLSGTPTAEMAAVDFTYVVEDAAAFMALQVFSIEVLASFNLPQVEDQLYTIGQELVPLALPAAMGGRSPYEYTLSPEPPAGVLYDGETRTLSGTPTAIMLPLTYTYTATDAAGVTTVQTFEITVGASESLIRDRAALIALFEATDGANWTSHTNWLDPPGDVVAFTEEALDAWFGVTVSAGRVVEVALPRNNLRGALPEALGGLTALAQLRLYGNSLEGTIPPALGQLDSLRGLLLHDNALTGPIPSELGNLAALDQLHLHNNGLTEPIPPALGNISGLKQLWLYGNSLEGTIPPALGQLDSLRGLLLHDNDLTGPIPSELGNLVPLKELWLQNNRLEGTIPPVLGRLDSLQGLLLSDNELTGVIPPELGDAAQLEELWLQGNHLVGAIPSSLGQLDSLRGLLLHENQLTGTIPLSLAHLSRLKWLQLQENALEGEIPPALGRLAQLERLQLEGNRFTGPLPDSLGQLAALTHLYVHENVLSGELPGVLVNLNSLKELFFGGPDQTICAPVDATFQAWLASLEAYKGPDCGSFGLQFTASVLDQQFRVGESIVDLTLPEAEGSAMPYHFTLSPALPAGLEFDASARVLRGTPTESVPYTSYTYTAVDGTGVVGQLTFAITVVPDMTDLLQLHGNYPNPFRGTTHLALSLARDARVSVYVFDLLGRRVLQQEPQRVEAGVHRRLAVNAANLAPGTYLYRVVAVIGQRVLVHTGHMALVR